jgi:hypothetical protein
MSKKLFSDHEPDPLIRELDGNILWEYRPMDPNDTRGPYSSLAPFKAAERLRAMTWRPIETAPKDGTFILAWFEEAQQHLLLWWFANHWRFKGNDTIPLMDPTHWMPLPEPPDVSRETQDKT